MRLLYQSYIIQNLERQMLLSFPFANWVSTVLYDALTLSLLVLHVAKCTV